MTHTPAPHLTARFRSLLVLILCKNVADMNTPSRVPIALSNRDEHYHHRCYRSSGSSSHLHHSKPERYAYQVHSSCQDNSSSHSLPRPSTPPPIAEPMQPSQPSQYQCFAHSKCVGHKKALCIGINYQGQPCKLKGCINDAIRIRDFLINHWGYKSEDIVMLTDDSTDPCSLPTKENMLEGIRWLVKDAQPHDSLFFHYSGHGGQTEDLDGDEVDGYDEIIFPVDYKDAGEIIDDVNSKTSDLSFSYSPPGQEMHLIMVKPLPSGCRLTALFDCCHSGTALDLPYISTTTGGSEIGKIVYIRRERILSMRRHPCFAVGRSGNNGIPNLIPIGLPSAQFDSSSDIGPYLILLDSNPIFTTLSAKLKLPWHHLTTSLTRLPSGSRHISRYIE
ncbi:hypothetical protein ARMGADRAFT_1085950 [Armillaria gallica]|uniref:Peptidase C14 caspase domain-containing protein n=1 Tax=Armillaria gallica TaxID=47427 RepID=A0A2H3D8M4_ARMGA|nr:hypothetical protein ARMGADRAFT_1085950 [Armillaria gallica]